MVREVEITIAGESYMIEANFDVAQRIEQKVDLMDYAAAIQREKMKISDTAWILYSALYPQRFTIQTVGKMTMDYPAEAHKAALEIVYQIVTPKSDKKKVPEEKAPGKQE